MSNCEHTEMQTCRRNNSTCSRGLNFSIKENIKSRKVSCDRPGTKYILMKSNIKAYISGKLQRKPVRNQIPIKNVSDEKTLNATCLTFPREKSSTCVLHCMFVCSVFAHSKITKVSTQYLCPLNDALCVLHITTIGKRMRQRIHVHSL